MSKYDIYLLENSRVLKNKLGIENEAALDKAESIMANTKMALLYNSSFSIFLHLVYARFTKPSSVMYMNGQANIESSMFRNKKPSLPVKVFGTPTGRISAEI